MKKKPDESFYRHILREAWDVTRHAKSIWIFGFFVSFLGVGGVYELLIQGTGKLGLSRDFGSYLVLSTILPSGSEILTALRSIGTYNIVAIALFMIAGLTLFIVAVWIVISSQGAIISGIREQHRKKKVNFSKMFAIGNESFWPLLGLNLLARFGIAASFYLMLSLMLLLLTKATLVSSLLYLIAFLLLMPLTLIIGFVTIYAAAYITLHQLTLVDAIETGIALFRKYWLISLETLVILFAINILVSIGLGLGITFVAILFVPLLIGVSLSGAGVGLWIIFILASVAGMALLVIVGSGLATFQYSVWTLLFLKLHTRGHRGVAKIVRALERFVT